jgi:hypothetical protein
MQHDISDILFSLFKMAFNLKGYVDQEFSNVNLIKICDEKSFYFYFDNKTEFLNKLNVILNRENKLSDVSCWILF